MKKSLESIRRIGLIANPEKVSCPDVVRKAAGLVVATGREVVADMATANIAGEGIQPARSLAALARHTDLILVFGGDGTMLRVARAVAGSNTPILGINAGGLGFLTAVPSRQLEEALAQVWAGQYIMESRPLIVATGTAHGQRLDQIAMNDFVIGRGVASRIIELEVAVDEQVLTQYRCDGLIVSTPTGSTAYSLAAGGAVVCPSADVFALTPICPHTLSNRSVIVSLNSSVQVKVISHKLETMITADGQVQIALAAGEVVTIRRSHRTVRLLHLAGSSFFDTLRQKLNWSGSNL